MPKLFKSLPITVAALALSACGHDAEHRVASGALAGAIAGGPPGALVGARVGSTLSQVFDHKTPKQR